MMADTVQRTHHAQLKSLACRLYRIPGAKYAFHRWARLMIQHTSLSLKNRQRLYNFFATDTLPS